MQRAQGTERLLVPRRTPLLGPEAAREGRRAGKSDAADDGEQACVELEEVQDRGAEYWM